MAKGKAKSNEYLGISTNITIRERDADDPNGEWKVVKKLHNVLRQEGINGLLQQMAGLATDKAPTKLGVGQASSTPNIPPVNLTSAVIKTILTSDKVFRGGRVYMFVNFSPDEANFSWNELGMLFADNTVIARKVDETPYVKVNTKTSSLEFNVSLTEITDSP